MGKAYNGIQGIGSVPNCIKVEGGGDGKTLPDSVKLQIKLHIKSLLRIVSKFTL